MKKQKQKKVKLNERKMGNTNEMINKPLNKQK